MTTTVRQRGWRVALCGAAALLGLACGSDQQAGDSDPQTATEPLVQVDALDLLLVVDDSGSMASEQVRLAAELDRLVRILTLGDRSPEAAPESDRSNKARYFNPVKSLHLGVISTNVGGIPEPAGEGVAILSCRGVGDGGKLLSETSVARDGVIAETPKEFEGFTTGEVVLPPDPSCALEPGPRYLELGSGSLESGEAVAQRFRCMARLGVRGCPFEQPFEAARRALAAPAADVSKLSAEEREVHAYNAGFLREDAVLAVVHISDEDDCSITSKGELLFDNRRGSEGERLYGERINLRCGLFGRDRGLLWDVARYAKHLKSLKPHHPERVLFAAIVGVPPGLAPELSYDELLKRPELQLTIDPSTDDTLFSPSCTRPNAENPARSDKAFPPRRFIELAKSLGAGASVHSICADDYGPSLAALVERVVPMMAP